MSDFKMYRRTNIAEMRPVTEKDIQDFEQDKYSHLIDIRDEKDTLFRVSVSAEDLNNGSPKMGDMIARNPKNHEDKWLVAKKYFEENFEAI